MNDTVKKLRAEARKLVATYTPDCDFDDLVTKLAGVGYRMIDAAVPLAKVNASLQSLTHVAKLNASGEGRLAFSFAKNT